MIPGIIRDRATHHDLIVDVAKVEGGSVFQFLSGSMVERRVVLRLLRESGLRIGIVVRES